MVSVRRNTWELRVTVGRRDDGRPRTLHRTVTASSKSDAAAQLAAFVDQMTSSPQPETKAIAELTVDEAIEQFLTEHLGADKGRADKTISDYRKVHNRWFAPTIGERRVNRIDTPTMDRLFGAMRQAGLSGSRMNQAKSLYAPFFRWPKRRGIAARGIRHDLEIFGDQLDLRVDLRAEKVGPRARTAL